MPSVCEISALVVSQHRSLLLFMNLSSWDDQDAGKHLSFISVIGGRGFHIEMKKNFWQVLKEGLAGRDLVNMANLVNQIFVKNFYEEFRSGWKHNSYYLFVTICLVFLIFNSTFLSCSFTVQKLGLNWIKNK